MIKNSNQIKLISLQSRGGLPSQNSNRTIQLQLSLKEALSHIEVLKQANKSLSEKLSFYEKKCQDMKLLQEQLQFRKEEEKQMQQHLDNYQQINGKLREQILQLQTTLKSREVAKSHNRSAYQQSQSNCGDSRKMSTNVCFQDSKLQSGRRSFGDIQKQNHPLTPKSRVNINFEKINRNQLDSMHQIQARRKVFL